MGGRRMLLVTRYDDASTLPAATRTIGEASVLDECVFEHFAPMFHASCEFEAGSVDRANWLLDDLRARSCEQVQIERIVRQLLRALSTDRIDMESIVSCGCVN